MHGQGLSALISPGVLWTSTKPNEYSLHLSVRKWSLGTAFRFEDLEAEEVIMNHRRRADSGCYPPARCTA
jgi:hypothetical protein